MWIFRVAGALWQEALPVGKDAFTEKRLQDGPSVWYTDHLQTKRMRPLPSK